MEGQPDQSTPMSAWNEQTSIMAIMRHRIPRFVFAGAQYSDIDVVLQKITGRGSWVEAWAEAGKRYEDFGLEAEEKKRAVSAKESFLLATIYYQLAQSDLFDFSKQKFDLYGKVMENYMRAARYFDGSLERVEIPFGMGKKAPGYFWKQQGREKKPAVLVLHGADSTKEEYHTFVEYFFKRGLNTLIIDGPGQGETRLHQDVPMDDAEFTKAATAAVDFLLAQPEVDQDRIGVAGQCMGGYQALRHAGNDHRLKACYAISPFFRSSSWFGMMVPAPIKKSILFVYGASSQEELIERVGGDLTIEAEARKIQCPTLVMHGKADIFVPNEDAEALRDSIGGPKDFIAYEGGMHALMNLSVLPRMLGADWMAEKLAAS